MLFRVDPTSAQPLFEQVAGSVRRALHEGELGAGDRLPPAREVAGSLQVNLHTVLRAYQQLRDEGLVDLRRGRGAVVTGADPAAHAAVRRAARTLVEAARTAGLQVDEVHHIVSQEWS
ncbi:GntR family transcriptional regulator [Lapillicoccus jejuensis]|uniref:GntR family transcriptional regulator n=1 Tax=Lapillicoccus jejuensis TaxID=402171 RepID=A0A542DVP0_9MICO|nr:GntR family transcriptional regulator [Lapillicoccus jejuensis]TQJ07169.1 GntR family transcriptional regulator [Lapillicoccus jejuensis]